MAKVFIEETTLSAIGDAIRNKTGKTELIDPLNMGAEIESIEAGSGGGDLPEEAFSITGNCSNRFANSNWDWFIENYGNRVTTADISNAANMFSDSKVEEIPFVINIKGAVSIYSMFSKMTNITKCPKVRGTITWNTGTALDDIVGNCTVISDLEDLFDPEMLDGFKNVKVTSAYSCPKLCNFGSCKSLLSIPSWWYKFQLCEESTAYPSATYCMYAGAFAYCYSIAKVSNIPVWRCQGAQTSNMLNSTVQYAHMLDTFTFATIEGQPITTKWKSQVFDLTKYVGYTTANGPSGLTWDTSKRVSNNTAYQARKNDPDWWTTDVAYSRYNHDSAVATINSLPDTSAYLASAGGTNTIKFQGAAGSKTDGGAINTLTAEEIAVAAAKGWTVTLA